MPAGYNWRISDAKSLDALFIRSAVADHSRSGPVNSRTKHGQRFDARHVSDGRLDAQGALAMREAAMMPRHTDTLYGLAREAWTLLLDGWTVFAVISARVVARFARRCGTGGFDVQMLGAKRCVVTAPSRVAS